MLLIIGMVGFLGLESLRSTLVFLGGVTSTGLTISLIGDSEEETICGMILRHKDAIFKT